MAHDYDSENEDKILLQIISSTKENFDTSRFVGLPIFPHQW